MRANKHRPARQNLRGRALSYAIVAMTLLVGVMPAAAQQGRATIHGTVTDESGGPTPGVTVIATSSALQVPSLTAVTDKEGAYQLTDVPIGTYRLQYELAGFQTVIRDGVILPVGFVARIDIVLKIGALQESLTVSGVSPIVDTTTTTPVQNFTNETLAILPTTRQQYSILAMTPGIRMTGALDVGGSLIGTQQPYKNYGSSGQVTPTIEGVNFRQDTDLAGVFMDYYAYQEFQVQAAGMDADIGLPGTAWGGVVKSGGNQFHGDLIGAYQPGQLQRPNIDDYLRTHGVVGVGNKLDHLYDTFADLGGRLKKDKLWFYVALRKQNKDQNVTNYFSDSVLGTTGLEGNGMSVLDSHPVSNQTLKVSYQMTGTLKLVGFIQRTTKNLHSQTAENQAAGPPFTADASSRSLIYTPTPMKFEFQGAPSNRLFFTTQLGYQYLDAQWHAQDGTDVPGNPTQRDLFTGWYHGPNEGASTHLIRERWEPRGDLTFMPGRFLGHHTLKAGFYGDLIHAGSPTEGKCGANPGATGQPYCAGNYTLLFNRINGQTFQPFQIQIDNSPVTGANQRLTEASFYLKDQWQVSRRLNVNLGLRIEHYHSWVAASEKPVGQFSAAGSFPEVDVLTWLSGAPRLGAVYDLSGNGKTVVKGSWGWYNWTMGDTFFAGQFDKNARVVSTFNWSGPCVTTAYTTCDYLPGSVNLSPTSPAFVTRTTPGTTLLNPNLKQPRTYETTATLEHELGGNSSVRVLYVYRTQSQVFQLINPARPYDAYSVPVLVQDPGPDGKLGTADDQGTLTLLDYRPEFAGVNFTTSEFANTPSANSSTFHTVDVTFNKRMGGRWGLLASFSALKNHRWLIGTNGAAVAQSPNDLINTIDNTWERNGKVQLTYRLPYDIMFAAVDQLQEGFGRQRTFLFTGLPQSRSLSVAVEPFGQSRLPYQQLLNVSLSKAIRVQQQGHLRLRVDVFNALNANTPTSISDAAGPSYNRVTGYLPGMVTRFGVEYGF